MIISILEISDTIYYMSLRTIKDAYYKFPCFFQWPGLLRGLPRASSLSLSKPAGFSRIYRSGLANRIPNRALCCEEICNPDRLRTIFWTSLSRCLVCRLKTTQFWGRLLGKSVVKDDSYSICIFFKTQTIPFSCE